MDLHDRAATPTSPALKRVLRPGRRRGRAGEPAHLRLRRPGGARRTRADLGVALQIVNIMRDVAEDAERGPHLPAPGRDGGPRGDRRRRPRRARRATGFRVADARPGRPRATTTSRAASGCCRCSTGARACASRCSSGLYRAILDEIEARDYDVFGERVALSTAAQARADGPRRRSPALTVGDAAPRVVVCGGGLAGIAAACEASLLRRRRDPGRAPPVPRRQGLQLRRRRRRRGGRQRPARVPRLLHRLHRAAAAARRRTATRRSSRPSTRPCATAPGAPGRCARRACRRRFTSARRSRPTRCSQRAREGRGAAGAAGAGRAARGAARRARRGDVRRMAHRATARAPGAIERFWDLIVLPTCNDRSDRVSAALAAFVFQEGFLRTRTGSAIGWSTRGAHAPGRPAGAPVPRGARRRGS